MREFKIGDMVYIKDHTGHSTVANAPIGTIGTIIESGHSGGDKHYTVDLLLDNKENCASLYWYTELGLLAETTLLGKILYE